MAFIYRDRISIHYQWLNQGRDKTIVLINSLGANLVIWSDVVPLIRDEFNVLMFDKRGHGLSSTTEGRLSIEDYADDVIHLMDALGIEEAHVLGLSIGGLVVYSLASRYPGRFEKLIFSNTGAKLGTAEAWNERIRQIEKGGIASIAESIVERWLSSGFRKAHPAETEGCLNMLKANTQLGYIQACAAIRDADYHPVLSEIKHPARFIGGSADESTTPELIIENARQLGAERVEILEGAGHLPCIETPEEVARVILEFMAPRQPSPATLQEAYRLGMKIRRAVLGDAHVDRAEAGKTDFDKDFQEYIVHSAWSAVWSRPGLSKRDRSLITIALLTALGHEEELAMHMRATKNTGATEEEVKEVLLHAGVYAGVPATNKAMKIAKKIFEDLKHLKKE
jgi:3-oxoadipate enol-lactonase/4-carboxymuconolactone decarboxylase